MTMPDEKQTAMRREFLRVRQAHPGKIIFWQRGDFFETFEDDAKLVSTELDLQLTTGSFGKLKVPMAGVPVNKVWSYVQRLVARNYHVVIVEEREGAIPAHQRADRRQQDRVVTRILTWRIACCAPHCAKGCTAWATWSGRPRGCCRGRRRRATSCACGRGCGGCRSSPGCWGSCGSRRRPTRGTWSWR